MTFFIIVLVAFIIWLIYKANSKPSTRTTTNQPNRTTRSATTPKTPYSYRPTTTRKESVVKFLKSASSLDDLKNISDLHDAFTGEKLDVLKELYRFSTCKVYYHRASYDVILSENHGKCVACKKPTLISITSKDASSTSGRDHHISTVTLVNYKSFEGQVITFEGYVPRINYSKTGSIAVMFQDESWVHGLKLVVFGGKVDDVGGYSYLTNMKNKKVCVRGLIVNHHKYGWQIIVTSRSMILKIS